MLTVLLTTNLIIAAERHGQTNGNGLPWPQLLSIIVPNNEQTSGLTTVRNWNLCSTETCAYITSI